MEEEKKKNSPKPREYLFSRWWVLLLFVISFPGGVMLYSINWSRMGYKVNGILSGLFAVACFPLFIALTHYANFSSLRAGINDATIRFYPFVIISVVILIVWQRKAFNQWVEVYGKPRLRDAGIFKVFTCLLLGWLFMLIFAFFSGSIQQEVERIAFYEPPKTITVDGITFTYPGTWQENPDKSVCSSFNGCRVSLKSLDSQILVNVFEFDRSLVSFEQLVNNIKLNPQISIVRENESVIDDYPTLIIEVVTGSFTVKSAIVGIITLEDRFVVFAADYINFASFDTLMNVLNSMTFD
jgi:hypothetical protein